MSRRITQRQAPWDGGTNRSTGSHTKHYSGRLIEERTQPLRRSLPNAPTATKSSRSSRSTDPALLMAVDSNVASLYTGYSRRGGSDAGVIKKGDKPLAMPTSSSSSAVVEPRLASHFPYQEKELDPVKDGALQFVPAFHDGGASWDAILSDDEKKEDHSPTMYHNHTKANSIASFQRKYTEAAERSSSTSATGGRIARIKSLFSSRSTIRGATTAGLTSPMVPSTTPELSSIPPPPSPAHSNSSSAYVRWPGTQDPTGKTVLSSYDDSSVGRSSKGPAPFAKTRAVDNNDEMLQAEQQISQWTANTSASTNPDDDFGSVESLSPTRRNSCLLSPVYPRRQSEGVFPDCDMPESAADFHLAAAIADAEAAAAARDGTSVAALRQRFSQPTETHVSQRRSILAHAGDINADLLRQVVPLIRSKASISNSHNVARSRTQSLTKEAAPSVRFAPSRSLPTGSIPSNKPLWVRSSSEADVASANNWSPASKTSSAYFNDRDIAAMHLDFPDLDIGNATENLHDSSHRSQLSEDLPFRNKQQSIRSVSAKACQSDGGQVDHEDAVAETRRSLVRSTPQPPTKDALEKNYQFQASHRNFATGTTQGFRGLLDKGKEVPSLMDNNCDSDSMSSSKAPSNSGGNNYRANYTQNTAGDMESESDIFDGISVSKESDVFDNISFGDHRGTPRKGLGSRQLASYPERINEEDDDNVVSTFGTGQPADDGEFKLVLLGGGLTAIQSTKSDFMNRCTASDFDGNLSVSDVSSNGYARIPGFSEMVSAGKSHDNSLQGIQGNLGMQPRSRQLMLDTNENNRRGASYQSDSDSSSQRSETSHRSSLFTDPYRGDVGLELFGNLSEYYVHPTLMKKVLRKYRNLSDSSAKKMNFADSENEEDERKAFALFEMRTRVMEKDIERGLERRGGSFVVDDIVTTSYNRTAHRIRDAVIVSKAWRDGATISDIVNSAVLTRRMAHSHFIMRCSQTENTVTRYSWEAVRWLDDTDMMQYRCPSLGSRHMRGFDMFTIGDCQSILLKLTNERCLELRHELNKATSKQIIAEERLKEEGDIVDGMMSETEMTYLMTMEEVKTISKRLVSTESAFTLVRDRIKKLISRYETMLLKIETETESAAGASSVVTYESSFYSDVDTSEYRNEEERIWARRAVRAEVRAEIAVREALLAKQTAKKVYDKKTHEIQTLKKRLDELKSECSSASAEKERLLAKSAHHASSVPNASHRATSISKEKLDGVKKRFRDRMQAKKQPVVTSNGRAPLYPTAPRRITPSPQAQAERELMRSAGEEMYQQMIFYERSLEAVGSDLL